MKNCFSKKLFCKAVKKYTVLSINILLEIFSNDQQFAYEGTFSTVKSLFDRVYAQTIDLTHKMKLLFSNIYQ
jgi:Txe/YoeB family toxin of Txe-Axe toxin-antitoxin module